MNDNEWEWASERSWTFMNVRGRSEFKVVNDQSSILYRKCKERKYNQKNNLNYFFIITIFKKNYHLLPF